MLSQSHHEGVWLVYLRRNVRDDDAWRGPWRGGFRAPEIRSCFDGEALGAEGIHQGSLHQGVFLENEKGKPARIEEGESDSGAGARVSGVVTERDASTVVFDNLFGDGQTESCALPMRFRGGERLEQAFLHLRGNARAIVIDRDRDAILV